MLVWQNTKTGLLPWLAVLGLLALLFSTSVFAADDATQASQTTASIAASAPDIQPPEPGAPSAIISSQDFLVAKLCTYGLTLIAVACGGIVYLRRHRALLPFETLAGVGLVALIMVAGVWLIRSQVLEPAPLACLDSTLGVSSDYTDQCRRARESFANVYGGKTVLRWLSPQTVNAGVVAPIAVGTNRLIFYGSALLWALIGFAIVRAVIRKKL